MNIPNALTIFRVAASPALMGLLLVDDIHARLAALILFMMAGLSDLFDGMIARRRNQETGFGRFMDPIADKLLISMALISFVALNMAAAWVVLVIIAREFLIMGLRTLVAYRGEVMESSWMAKAKTFLQMASVAAILCCVFARDAVEAGWLPGSWLSGPGARMTADALLYLAMAMTLASGLDYIYKSRWLILSLFRDNF
ncbi:MAG TPA: CDP-diacylglycerol--glycerol-3-phosphate 3-phosphatidyltransferase [candidate division Zixibacteria bacterium]|jgi:CDP-diacylglycerol--glycerol-3-phosphate 3-phosphatidyltransferase|nr:CDP-diacylglycerol--glycerol-3-phosphate 3-phosphatidyltransferase [candidate division Zixibacteria bacterium]